VAEIHVGVCVEEADERLARVAAGTDQGHPGGLGVGGVVLAERWVGVGGGAGVTTGLRWAATDDAGGWAGGGGEGAGLLLCAGDGGGHAGCGRCGAVETCLEVGVAEHGAAVLGELGHELCDFLAGLDAVPEHDLAVLGEAALGLVEEPGQVLVVFLDGEDELRVVLLDGSEDVIGDIGEPAGLGDGEGG